MRVSDGSVGYLDVLRANPGYRRIWLADVISMFGDWFNLVASASVIGKLTGSGMAIGSLFLVRMMAPFVASPFGGVLADRCSRKRVMIVSDLLRVPVAFGFLLVQSEQQIWLLYVLTALQLGLSGVFAPARTAIIPDIVSSEHLGAANSLSSTTYAVMQAIGAGIGGLTSGVLGASTTYVVDGLTFVVSAALCAGVMVRERPRAAPLRQLSVGVGFAEFLEGLHYLKRDPESLVLALHKAANCLVVTGGLNVALVTLAQRFFASADGGSMSSGLLFAATGIGTAIGAIASRLVVRDDPRGLRLGLLGAYGVTALGLSLAAPHESFLMLFLGVVLRGVGGGMLFDFSTQLLMQRVPDAVRGRVFSLEFALRTLMSATGTALVSSAIDSGMPVESLLRYSALGALVPGTLWAVWILGHAREAEAVTAPRT